MILTIRKIIQNLIALVYEPWEEQCLDILSIATFLPKFGGNFHDALRGKTLYAWMD